MKIATTCRLNVQWLERMNDGIMGGGDSGGVDGGSNDGAGCDALITLVQSSNDITIINDHY